MRGSVQGSSYTGPGLGMVLNLDIVNIFQASPPGMAGGIKRSCSFCSVDIFEGKWFPHRQIHSCYFFDEHISVI